MFDWFKPNDVLWLIPLAPLVACLWIVLVGHAVRRQYAHRPVVLALAVSFAAAVYLLTSVVPGGFGSAGEHGEHAGASHAIVTTIYQWIKVGQLDVAVTLRACDIATVHVGALPEQEPLHAVNVLLDDAVAVNVTDVPLL